MGEVRMKEAAALEVGAPDVARGRAPGNGEEVVVREPVDSTPRRMHEHGVLRRRSGTLAGDFDVDRRRSALRLAARATVGLPLDEPAGEERIDDLRGHRSRAAGDREERVDLEDAVDAREHVRLLRSEWKVLVTRH